MLSVFRADPGQRLGGKGSHVREPGTRPASEGDPSKKKNLDFPNYASKEKIRRILFREMVGMVPSSRGKRVARPIKGGSSDRLYGLAKDLG